MIAVTLLHNGRTGTGSLHATSGHDVSGGGPTHFTGLCCQQVRWSTMLGRQVKDTKSPQNGE